MTRQHHGGEPVPDRPLLLDALLDLAVTAATHAGRLLVEQRPRDVGVAATKSSDTDIVTTMDTRAQELLIDQLLAARPDDGVLGEEAGGGVAGTSGIVWVLDPIDGTVNYLYDLPAYGVSVAAVTGDPTVPGDWHPLVGAVAHPARSCTYWAVHGRGAWRRDAGGQDRRLHSGSCTHLGQALVGTGFGYRASRRAWQAAVLTHVLPRVRDIRRIGSAALDLCAVAEGSLDGFYERGLHPWDLAAGLLIAHEAGALVTGLAGDAPGVSMTVAAGAGLHPSLLELVATAVDRAHADGVRDLE